MSTESSSSSGSGHFSGTDFAPMVGNVAQNVFEFLPEEIERDAVINLRPFEQDALGAIEAMAESIKAHGQIEPVVVRVDSTGRPHLIAGSRRVTAIGLLNSGLENGDEPYRVKAVVSLADSDAQAWGAAWAENKDRKDMSPMDVAMNIGAARVMFGLEGKGKTKEIARKLGVSPAYVTTHEKLLGLPKAIQGKVHEGKLSVDAALKVANVPEEARDEVVRQAETLARTEADRTTAPEGDKGEPAPAGAGDRARKSKAGKGGKGSVKARHITAAKRKVAGAETKPTPRSKQEFIEFVESELLSPVFGYAGGDVHTFANELLRWFKGESSDRKVLEKFKAMARGAEKGKPEPKPELTAGAGASAPAPAKKQAKAASKAKPKAKKAAIKRAPKAKPKK